jgi:5-methyltetrahydrofolate--homocysteine methyltransferase
VDLIGLSGLITPSLEEMAFVAGEMQRLGLRIPLLIGGATTSKVHTAVKIAPNYEGAVVHVLDASRAVGVAGSLLSDGLREKFEADVKADYEAVRVNRAGRRDAERLLPLEQARRNPVAIDWTAYAPPAPTFTGTRVFDDWPLEDLVPRVDWTPFFQTWELAGHYPAILRDPVVGEAARGLYADARAMLDRIVAGRLLRARAVVGLWPANAVGDDVVLWADDARTRPLETVHFLRQQLAKGDGRPNYCLADFVAPRTSGVPDFFGGFVVTTGVGLDALVAEFEAANDPYSSILAKALADRLAEAFAERLHERVRTELWGYSAGEALENAALIREEYRGIRPAPGYPACPDHTEKGPLFRLLGATEAIGVRLTESFAMTPTAAVSGYYIGHPQSRYFGVGKLGRDQVDDYATRRGIPVAEALRWLAPNLA